MIMMIIMIIISRRNTSVRGGGGTVQNADIEADCTHNGWPVKKQKREWGEKREKEKREGKRDEQEQEKMFSLERALYQVQRKK